MASIPELHISLETPSAVSIPSTVSSQSTAVFNKHSTSYTELRGDDDDFHAAIARFDDAQHFKPSFTVTPSLGTLDSQASLLDQHTTDHSNQPTWPRSLFHKQEHRASPPLVGKSWQPSWKRTGPLLGLAALAFILLTIPASALVLGLSNGKPVEQWRVQPSVYISVLTGIGNKALGFASIQGAILTWWLKAVKGTTLKDLHYDWPIGNGNFVLFSRRHISMLTVTSVCACVIFLDGSLLQSATYTIEENLSTPVILHALISPEIPTNYTATGALLNVDNTYMNADFSSGIEPVRKQWTDGGPIPSPLQGCEGVCTAKVLAPALTAVTDCHEDSTSWLNFTEIKEIRDMPTLPSGCHQSSNNIRCQLFNLQVFPSAASGSFERIDISYGRFIPVDDATGVHCAGNLTYKTCSFRAAIAEYTLTMRHNTSAALSTRDPPRVLALARNTARPPYPAYTQINTTIGGIALLGSKDFYSDIGVWSPGTEVQYTDNINRIQSRLIANADAFFQKKACAPMFEDPVPAVLDVLNQMMFSTAVYAARDLDEAELKARIDPSLEISYDVQGLRIDAQPVFRTRWVFFLGAAVVQMVCVRLVGWVYWGYWRLGRAVSLSPLEILGAFGTKLGDKSEDEIICAEGWRIAKMEGVGDRRVEYGVVGEKGRLGFGDEGEIVCLDIGRNHIR